MKKTLIASVLVSILSVLPCHSFTLGDKLKKAEKGDFIVTEQDKSYCILSIRDVKAESAILEEITVPCTSISKDTEWKSWVKEGAKGHTSWIMYEVSLEDFSLIESYSFTRKGWLFLDDSQHFLSRLFSLPLERLSEKDRKRTGPAPYGDEVDRRKLWNPTVKIDGKKIKTDCDVWKGSWPKDDTLLSRCDIVLYFGKSSNDISFPYWIEASNGHYTHSIKTIDSGKNLTSPLSHNIPHRPPKIAQIKKENSSVIFLIKSPAYYKNFEVYAFDITRPYENIGPFNHSIETTQEKGVKKIVISEKDLNLKLKQGNRYKWLLMPKSSGILYVESEDFFLWPTLAPK